MTNHKKSLLRSFTILCATILCAAPSLLQAGEIEGIHFPEKLKTGTSKLLLNGTALRTKWGFNVYAAGLYVTKRSHDENVIMKEDQSCKRVQISMLREVSADKFNSSIQESIEGNFSETEKRLFDSELKAFLGCFSGGSALKKSSVVLIDYIPEQGTVVSVDGRSFDLIPGSAFYHALLRLWIGNPTQESMKPGLLGRAG
jgi:hypothetical protein